MAWNLCLQKYEKGMTYPKGILSRFNRRIAQKGDVPFQTHPLFRWSWRLFAFHSNTFQIVVFDYKSNVLKNG